MHTLKLIFRTIIRWLRQAWLLPRSVVTGIGQWRSKVALNEINAERLDRIRHPSKYLGK
jgi:hypothetical protein